MRELEFRAWDKVEKKMLFNADPFALHVSGSNEPLLAETHRNEDCIFEQYTGLKDKNGQKIYEGDIVTFMVECFDSSTLGFDSEQWHTAVVEWNQDDACYSFMDGGEPFSVQFEAEVIGNIHEQPELLEAKNVD